MRIKSVSVLICLIIISMISMGCISDSNNNIYHYSNKEDTTVNTFIVVEKCSVIPNMIYECVIGSDGLKHYVSLNTRINMDVGKKYMCKNYDTCNEVI